MQYCKRCNIRIRGNKRVCPLCEGPLTGEPEQEVYPEIRRRPVSRLSLIKLTTFFFFAFEFVMGGILFLLQDRMLGWAPYVMVGAVFLYLDLMLAYYFKNNFLKMFTIQVYIGMVICYVIDRLTGYLGWSVAWVIPFAFVGLIVVTISFGAGFHMTLEEYAVYLIVDVLASYLQLIFLVNGTNRHPQPAVIVLICFSVGAAAAALFRFRSVKNASEKTFHM